jgi:hypothetical protein
VAIEWLYEKRALAPDVAKKDETLEEDIFEIDMNSYYNFLGRLKHRK